MERAAIDDHLTEDNLKTPSFSHIVLAHRFYLVELFELRVP